MPDDEVIEKDGIKVYLDKRHRRALPAKDLIIMLGEDGEGFMFTGGPSSSCEPGGCCGSSGGSCGH